MARNEFFPTLPGGTPATPLVSIALNSPPSRKYSIGQLLHCWALLVKLYTCRDDVSFVYTRAALCPGAAATTTLARVVSYRFQTGENETEDMVYQGWKPTHPSAGEQHRVNTAVVLHTGVVDNKGDLPSDWTGDIGEIAPTSLRVISAVSSAALIMQYRPDCVPPRYAECIARTFKRILDACSNGGLTTSIASLTLESTQEYLLHWNGQNLEAAAPARTCTINALVRTSVQNNPDAEAICAWDGRLSYRQLDTHSDILARRLIQTGVVKGARVAYAFTKSSWAVVAMLGILKAGGVFTALDPLQSHQRLEEMVRILGCTVLITSDLHVAKVSSLVAHALVLPRDALSHPPNSSSIGNTDADTPQPEISLQPDDAAFILFTSGSTGHPKAILHEHGAVCSHALALGDAMGYAKARVLQFAAYVWDVAVIDVFITLIFGGCVCIPSEEDRLSNIAAFIQWSEANLAILTPSYARTIDPETVPSLKTLGLAGECLTPEDVDRWRGRLTLMNVYGPAEVGACTLNAAVTALATGEVEGIRTGGVKNIGRALRSSPCWLVDPTDPNILVPVGAVGELLVSGPNLAREYLDLPAQTAASFIRDPTWAAALDLNGPRRFYRTGDLARYDIGAFDGSLVFMGRKDDQMKVRGQRIEPGEIEYHLQRVPGVKGAVVAIPACGPRKGELVAVVTTSQHRGQDHAHLNPLHGLSAETLPLSRIQDSISEALPDYMVPTACVVLAHLPLTASMKINRKEVKAWLEKMDDASQPQECSTAAAAAATLAETEQTAWVISTLLDEYLRSLHPDRPVRPKALGYDLSLHSAGLDSIQMITFLSMLRKRFGDVLSFPAVMKTRLLTVRSLAGLIDNTRTAIPPRSFQSVEIKAEIEELTQQLRKRLQSSNNQVHDNEIGIATAQAPRNVFLTGASGYLGNQILRELLSQPDMHVYILMRRPPPSGNNMPYEKSPPPNDPIRETAMLEGWWNRSLHTRYTIWPGDLAEKNLGLARSQLRLLAGSGPAGQCVHGIIHCGAVVHYTLDYESLQAANVLSTMTLLEIMGRSKVLSTFVFVSGGRNPTSMHTESPKPKQILEEDSLWNGYSQSKYISERLTLESSSALAPYFQVKHLCTVNPGYIIGSATTNWRANTRDFIWRLVAGCIEIGCYNQDEEDKWLFVSDVASVSRVVVTALLNPDPSSGGGAHAITEGIPFHTLWAILQHEYGYRLTGVPGTQWLQALRANVLGAGESHPLFTLLPVLETHGLHLGGQYDHSFGESNATAECVRRNIAYLAWIGFLPRPLS